MVLNISKSFKLGIKAKVILRFFYLQNQNKCKINIMVTKS